MARSSSNLLLKGAGAIVLLVVAAWVALTVLSIVASIVQWVLGILFTLAVLGVIGFGIYWLASRLLSGGDDGTRSEYGSALDLDTSMGSSTDDRDRTEQDPVETLREQYTNGRISEAEFERKLEEELGTRSLEREVGMREEADLERN